MSDEEIIDSLTTIMNTIGSVANGSVLTDYIAWDDMAAELLVIVQELKERKSGEGDGL